MKPRKVVLTLEVETDLPLASLRKAAAYDPISIMDCEAGRSLVVQQAQANVVAKPKK